MKRFPIAIVALTLMAAYTFAAPVEITGAEPVELHLNDAPRGIDGNEATKTVSVMKLRISPDAQSALINRLKPSDKRAFLEDGDSNETGAALSNKVTLGMGRVPVLDQGQHGTCVTFAATGALDAAFDKAEGDYISQLCNLTLGNYLEQHTSQPSGWDGSFGNLVLNQVSQFGVINKVKQHQNGCGGLKDYPRNNPYAHGDAMSPQVFAKFSETMPAGVYWQSVFTWDEAFDPKFNTAKALQDVKARLSEGHRVIFGTLLDVSVGQVGAVGTHHKPYDSWIVNDTIREHLRRGMIRAGHEMILTGYDDNLVIDGQKGAFILRNSWGRFAGDGGTYYMSYDYFKLMVHEAHAIYGRSDRVQ